MRRLAPWALVTLLALCAALTIALTEASKTSPPPATLKAAQLSPSDLGNGWKVEELRAATAPASRGLATCPGHPTIAGPYSRSWFVKPIGLDTTSFSVLIMQPWVGAQAVFDTLVRCISAMAVPGERPFRRTSAFDGLAQASAAVIQSGPSGSDQRDVSGWFVQGDTFLAVGYLGPAPLSQVREWAADAVAKAAASTEQVCWVRAKEPSTNTGDGAFSPNGTTTPPMDHGRCTQATSPGATLMR